MLLVIEVADSTLRYDPAVKADLYARHEIRDFWLVNLPDRVLEVYRDPAGGTYSTKVVLTSSDVAVPEALPGIRVDLAALLAD